MKKEIEKATEPTVAYVEESNELDNGVSFITDNTWEEDTKRWAMLMSETKNKAAEKEKSEIKGDKKKNTKKNASENNNSIMRSENASSAKLGSKEKSNDASKDRKGSLHQGHRKSTINTYVLKDAHAPDHVLLEMLLYFSIDRRDTNEIAHNLINRFGDFNRAIDAPIDLLKNEIDGVGDVSAQLIHLVSLIVHRYAEMNSNTLISKGSAVKTREDMARVFVPKFMGLEYERVCLMVLDSKNRIIFCDFINSGDLSSADIKTRVIMEKVLACGGSRIVVAHNHPSGNPEPSDADVAVTNNLRRTCEQFSVEVIDHIVVAGDKYASVFDTMAELYKVENVTKRLFAEHPNISAKGKKKK